MEKFFLKVVFILFSIPTLLILFLLSIYIRLIKEKNKSPKLVWGATPIISNKYWSLALQQAGYSSITLMKGFYPSINRASDFDMYVYDPKFIQVRILKRLYNVFFASYVSFCYAIWKFDIFHISFDGFLLHDTPLCYYEAFLLKLAGKKTIVISYGGDAYMYSRIVDPAWRHALQTHYPDAAKNEKRIQARVAYWTQHADFIIGWMMSIDGQGRWDMLLTVPFTIDTGLWQPKETLSNADGINHPVTIAHTPNHRGVKGTEFLINAVKELQNEGLKIVLLLIEKKQNDDLHQILYTQADILADQFIATAYAMSAIEGMALGIPVVANLENDIYTRTFRRYSSLNECPIVSTTPENLKTNLKMLITNPILRQKLGESGRLYVQNYHSEKTAQFLFKKIYNTIWHGKNEILTHPFHPILKYTIYD